MQIQYSRLNSRWPILNVAIGVKVDIFYTSGEDKEMFSKRITANMSIILNSYFYLIIVLQNTSQLYKKKCKDESYNDQISDSIITLLERQYFFCSIL